MECLLVYSIEGIAFVLERQSFLRILWNWPCPYEISDAHNVVYVTCSAIFFFGRLHSGGIAQYYLYSGSLLDKWGTIRSPFSMWTSSQSLLSFGYTSHRADTVTVVVSIVDTHVEMFTQFFQGLQRLRKNWRKSHFDPILDVVVSIMLLSIYSQDDVIGTHGWEISLASIFTTFWWDFLNKNPACIFWLFCEKVHTIELLEWLGSVSRAIWWFVGINVLTCNVNYILYYIYIYVYIYIYIHRYIYIYKYNIYR